MEFSARQKIKMRGLTLLYKCIAMVQLGYKEALYLSASILEDWHLTLSHNKVKIKIKIQRTNKFLSNKIKIKIKHNLKKKKKTLRFWCLASAINPICSKQLDPKATYSQTYSTQIAFTHRILLNKPRCIFPRVLVFAPEYYLHSFLEYCSRPAASSI